MSKALRGEVWEVKFKPAVGAEIQKIRPAVVRKAMGSHLNS
jgi:mRNA-degrading endonuclease toxin of MazEF toxin-antitoxin module